MTYVAAEDRYDSMPYRRCGRSGLKLPAISLGLWHNFGDDTPLETQRAILRRAFDLGITHFDLANNYGPPYGSAEKNFGRILREDLRALPRRADHLDQGRLRHVARARTASGARASTCSPSLDQSLERMGLDYVDIFYSHRFDPETPLEETMGALDTRGAPGQGALRRHLLLLAPSARAEAAAILRELGTPLLIHQPSYSHAQPLDRGRTCSTCSASEGVGCIAFSPLAQGMLTDRYLDGIPEDSRAAQGLAPQDGLPQRGEPGARPGAQRDRARGAARRSRRWRSPGCCATRA